MTKLLRPQTLAEGFTQSELSVLSNCPEKWNNQYNLLLYKPGVISFPLIVGSIFHDAMEQLFATHGKRVEVATLQSKFIEGQVPTLEDLSKVEYWNTVVPVMVEAYRQYYRNDFLLDNIESLEETIEIEYKGFRLRGKIDRTTIEDGVRVITDYKTTSRVTREIVIGWEFRFQFMFYLWLKSKAIKATKSGPPIGSFRVDAVKKTELRVKKNESLPEFAQRVLQDMVIEPDKYFYRERFPLVDGALEHFEKTVLSHKLNRLAAIVNSDTPLDIANLLIHDKNTDECQRFGSVCPYIDLCKHGHENFRQFYRTRQHKHQELEESIE